MTIAIDNHPDAFNRDTFVQQRVAQLIDQYRIATIIETGTYHGVTTAYLAEFGLPVHTIETNPLYLLTAIARLSTHSNVITHLGASHEMLGPVLRQATGPVLFFLDAHWGFNPLKGELNIIADHGLSDSVIIIHDFKVPNCNLGYDADHDSVPLSYDYIKDILPRIYTTWETEYNDEAHATGAMRGVVYLKPGCIV